ncbi:MAG TPA: SDR family oxidoreductase [Acidimicrobiales bacterium]|nr:SDR family oxidoreductase [Acidimicrobiales bacterium]
MTNHRGIRDLSGRTVVVTGGGRGIGAAMARAFSERGARVAIGDLDGDLAAATAASLGGGAIGRRVDVTDRAAFASFLDDVEDTLGPLAVLVNNAGIMVVDSFLDEDPDRADLQIALNLTAVVHGSREGARRMRAHGGGHIVNVASAAGRMGFVGVSTYCATKFGVHGLSEALRRELHGTGVSVSCVMPGLVATELISGVDSHPLLPTVTPEYVAVRVVRAVERGRFAVFAPRVMPAFVAANALLPGRAMDVVMRVMGGDTLMMRGAHSPARRAYDERTGARPAVTEEVASSADDAPTRAQQTV